MASINILFISEAQVERTINKKRILFALLFVEPITTNEVTPFHLFIQSPLKFWDEIFYGVKPLDDQCLPFEYRPTLSFNMSCDEYIEIFNKLMSARPYTFNYFDKKALKSFKNLIWSRDVVHLAHWVFSNPKKMSSIQGWSSWISTSRI